MDSFILTADHSILAGWMGVLLCFFTGMIIGIISKDNKEGTSMVGVYSGERRRYIRLGHIAFGALGMVNIQAGLCLKAGFPITPLVQVLLMVGLVGMPLCCFLTAFKEKMFFTFPIPAISLFGAVFLFFTQMS